MISAASEPTAAAAASDPGAGPLGALLEKIEARTARMGIIGQGYVGLPLAMVVAETGFDVTGFDVDAARRDHAHQGSTHGDAMVAAGIDLAALQLPCRIPMNAEPIGELGHGHAEGAEQLARLGDPIALFDPELCRMADVARPLGPAGENG